MVAPTAAVPASRIEGVGGAKLEPNATDLHTRKLIRETALRILVP